RGIPPDGRRRARVARRPVRRARPRCPASASMTPQTTPTVGSNSGRSRTQFLPTVGGENGRFFIALAAIAGVALVLRIVFIVAVDPTVPALGDASAYRLLAEQLAHGQGYIRPFDNLLLHVHRPTAEYPPLFPLLLALPVRVGVHSVAGL